MPKRKTPSDEESSSSTTTSTPTPTSTTTPLDRIIYNFFSGIRPYLRPVQPTVAHIFPTHPTQHSSPTTTTSTSTHPTRYRSNYEVLITSHPTMPYRHPSSHPTSSPTHPNPQSTSSMPPPLHPIPKSRRQATSTLTRPIPTRPPPPLHPIRPSSPLPTSTQAHPMHLPSRVTSTMPPPLRRIQPRTTSTITHPTNIAPMPSSPSTPLTSQPPPSTYALACSSHYAAVTLTSTYPSTLPQPTIPSLCHINLTHTRSTLPSSRSRTVGTQTRPPRTRRHSI